VIFDHRCRLQQKPAAAAEQLPSPPQIRCRRRLRQKPATVVEPLPPPPTTKTRRRRKTTAAATQDKKPYDRNCAFFLRLRL
jgi:hypothetical protein